MQDVLTNHILAKLVVQYDEATDTLIWVAYGLDTTTFPALIVTTTGSDVNSSVLGAAVAAGIVDAWEGE